MLFIHHTQDDKSMKWILSLEFGKWCSFFFSTANCVVSVPEFLPPYLLTLSLSCKITFSLVYLCLGCYGIICPGRVIVESDIIRLGTNLTVRCQSNTERCGRHFAIDLNGKTVFEKTNCSFVKTEIFVNQPRFSLRCRVKENEKWHIVCGKDLTAGCKFI